MVRYEYCAYAAMFGRIDEEMLNSSSARISQCTGCMCNCRCSCSGGITSEVEWGEI